MIIDVVAAIFIRDRRILITRRHDCADLGGLWEFPGGKVEPGETREQALQREILEELGVFADIGPEYFAIEHHYTHRSVRLHFFLCTIRSGEPSAVDVADLQWVDPPDLDRFEFPEADRDLIVRLRNDPSL